MRHLAIVGQAPSRRTDGGQPLSGRSGARLARLIGLPIDEVRRKATMVNLLDRFPGARPGGAKGDAFDLARAVRRARRIERETKEEIVLLLGRGVGAAFRLPRTHPYFVPFWRGGRTFYIVPHPSGTNRWWNDRRHVLTAKTFLRSILWVAERPRPLRIATDLFVTGGKISAETADKFFRTHHFEQDVAEEQRPVRGGKNGN